MVLKGYILTDEQLEENNYPIPSNLAKALDEDKFGLLERTCDRCQRLYKVDDDGLQIVKEECVFHWGRLRRQRSNRGMYFSKRRYRKILSKHLLSFKKSM